MKEVTADLARVKSAANDWPNHPHGMYSQMHGDEHGTLR